MYRRVEEDVIISQMHEETLDMASPVLISLPGEIDSISILLVPIAYLNGTM